MAGRAAKSLIGLLVALASPCASAVPPLPDDKRVPAAVITTLSTENPAFHMPTDVAVDSKGNVFVADGARDRVVTFGPDHKLKSATTQPAKQPLRRPVGVTVDFKDNLWIADTANHRVLVIGPDGNLVANVALPKTAAGKDADPTDVAITPDGGRAYVVDNPNHQVFVRDNDIGQWSVLGRRGSAVGQFEFPFMAAVGNNNDVLVTEAIGSRVQLITRDDRWAGVIGSWGVELGQFHRPKGIATDKAGRIFVSDSTLNVIQVFDPRGRVQGVLTDRDGRPLYFKHPMGMAFDAKGRLCVVELSANRVAIVSWEPRKE